MAQYDDLTALEKKALGLYIGHLNAWALNSDGEAAHQLKPEDFFSQDWDETYRVSYIDTGWYCLTVLSAGTGDDGGPSNLYIWSNSPNTPVPGAEQHIAYIVQEFDTSFFPVYDSDKPEAGLPKDDKAEWAELERLIRWALDHVPSHKSDHRITDALKLSGAFAASVQTHLQDA
jgi:hypothetical protein